MFSSTYHVNKAHSAVPSEKRRHTPRRKTRRLAKKMGIGKKRRHSIIGHQKKRGPSQFINGQSAQKVSKTVFSPLTRRLSLKLSSRSQCSYIENTKWFMQQTAIPFLAR